MKPRRGSVTVIGYAMTERAKMVPAGTADSEMTVRTKQIASTHLMKALTRLAFLMLCDKERSDRHGNPVRPAAFGFFASWSWRFN